MSITFSTAGGIGDEQDREIYDGLYYIFEFLRQLREGSNGLQPYFQPLLLLARRTEEQQKKKEQMKKLMNR
ncbi:MAG: hypothetical protein EZS28_001702 [Streblomastix strix]|uniref:Uncharacterized protein n=1 Tax=Streblomastix strix TaxID=222440 RepID=A0A5J4X678_9EUKA|nr:MAG: hypothetical protein EZS28_001702 [Streblomastix strix]